MDDRLVELLDWKYACAIVMLAKNNIFENWTNHHRQIEKSKDFIITII